jgi:LacI family transcriptional regulator
LTDAGIEPAPAWHVCSEYEIRPAKEKSLALFAMTPRPTAIFAGSDATALGVMLQARELGLRIPEDMSLVGFDGMPMVELLGPPLSGVVQPIDELGRLGVEWLTAMLAGKRVEPDQTRLPVTMVTRESVAPPRPARRQFARASGRR